MEEYMIDYNYIRPVIDYLDDEWEVTETPLITVTVGVWDYEYRCR